MYLLRCAFSSISFCMYKEGLENKICAWNIEGEFLQLNCYESFFSMHITWKLTAKRPAGRHEDANKKDIYRRWALFPLFSITLALSVARTSIDFVVHRRRWLINDRCIKLRLHPQIYPCTLSPLQFHEHILPCAPLVTNSSSALTSVLSHPFDLIRRVLHPSSVYTTDVDPFSAFLHPPGPILDVPRSACRIVLAIKVAYVPEPALCSWTVEITRVWKTCPPDPPVSIAFVTDARRSR